MRNNKIKKIIKYLESLKTHGDNSDVLMSGPEGTGYLADFIEGQIERVKMIDRTTQEVIL